MKKYGENKATKEKIESVAFGEGMVDSWGGVFILADEALSRNSNDK